MRRIFLSGLSVLASLVWGCGHKPPAPKAAGAPVASGAAPVAVAASGSAPVASSPSASSPSASSAPSAFAVDDGFAKPPPGELHPVPTAIRKKLAEQKGEVRDMRVLAGVVGDTRGRARALGEVAAIEDELGAIDGTLARPDSATLDVAARRLGALESKIGVLHEALRAADPAPGAPVIKD